MEQKRLKGQNFDVAKHVEQSMEEKLEEVRGTCRILGFDDVRDLGFEDDDILLNQEKIDAIADMIRQAKPDILIAHDPYESGGLKMHSTISQATIYAWQIAAGNGRSRQVGHSVPCIYFMNPMAYMGNNSFEYAGTSRADLYVDITGVIEKKVQALDHIFSQFYSGSYSRKRAETDDRAHGHSAYVAYDFTLWFVICYPLPTLSWTALTNHLKPVWTNGAKCQVAFYHYRLTWILLPITGFPKKNIVIDNWQSQQNSDSNCLKLAI